MHRLALIAGAATLAGLLLSSVIMASHEFAFVIQQMLSGRGN